MTVVVDRLAVAVNAHDLDAVADLVHEDYRSEQPAHPGRAFAGRADARQLGGHVRGDPRLSRGDLPVGPGR